MGNLNSKHRSFFVEQEDVGLRLDRWFHRHLPFLTQGQIQKGLRKGDIRVDDQRSESFQRLRQGQKISIFEGIVAQQDKPPIAVPFVKKPSPRIVKEATALQEAILYQDKDVLVLNKPAGLATQGGTGLSSHVDQLIALEMKSKAYLVHRLDRDTSGVLLIALHPQAAAFLGKAFREREITKIYWALVVGMPPHKTGEISLALQKRPGRQGEKMEIVSEDEGKEAITAYRVIDSAPDGSWSWLELIPHTGRTHQLRVHCAAIGCPILGDGKYGGKEAFLFGRVPLHLHARSLHFSHPCGESKTVKAPLPSHMEATWRELGLGETDV